MLIIRDEHARYNVSVPIDIEVASVSDMDMPEHADPKNRAKNHRLIKVIW